MTNRIREQLTRSDTLWLLRDQWNFAVALSDEMEVGGSSPEWKAFVSDVWLQIFSGDWKQWELSYLMSMKTAWRN